MNMTKHSAADVCEYLHSLGKLENIRPVEVTLDGVTYQGAAYIDPQFGDNTRLYLLGSHPKQKRKSSCWKFEGKDWYICCYTSDRCLEPEFKQYHPFGHSFVMSIWDIPNQPEVRIDSYERYAYVRLPMTIRYLDETNVLDLGNLTDE